MKQIPFATNYRITQNGLVYGPKLKTPLVPALHKGGYLRLKIKCDDGKKRSFLVHRIVAITYLENPENKPEVNHKNGIKTDNRVENLEWATRHENMSHAFSNGFNSNKLEKNGRTVLEIEEVIEIYYKLLNGARVVDVAREYSVANSTIHDIKSKKNWEEVLNNLPEISIKNKTNLSESKVRWICEELQRGVGNAEIVKKCDGVTIAQIEGIKYRRFFKHISCNYNW